MSRLVLILGCHRSGTSAVASAIRRLGVELGDRLLGPARGNDLGHFEDLGFLDFDEALLRDMGSAWDRLAPLDFSKIPAMRPGDAINMLCSQTVLYPVFGLKEPRLCRLLPFWAPIFALAGCEVSCVFVLRNPLSVADSLRERDGIGPERALSLWLVYNAEMWSATSGCKMNPRVVVDYDRFADDPLRELGRISAGLGLVPEGEIAPEAREIFAPSQRHHKRTAADALSSPLIPASLARAYRALMAASIGGDLEIADAEMAAVAKDVARGAPQLAAMDQRDATAKAARRLARGSYASFNPKWTP